jgi:hypothetical protein
MVFNRNVGLSLPIEVLHLHSPGPCINRPPTVIYQVGHYNFSVTLAGNPNGYLVVYQRCCRIAGINNLLGSSAVGATYVAEIPGTNPLATAPANNSAHFVGPDTVIVCQHNSSTALMLSMAMVILCLILFVMLMLEGPAHRLPLIHQRRHLT